MNGTILATMAGEYLSFIDNNIMLDGKIKRQIVSVLDDRTRRQSANMDGQIANKDGFLYPNTVRYQVPGNTGIPKYDINDREGTIQVIDGITPESRRGRDPVTRKKRGRDPVTGKNEVFSYVNFDKWAESKGLTKNRYGEYYKPKQEKNQ